jgi:hypothetical protein
MDKITKIGTNSKVLVPRPEICSIVTLKPNKATPKRSIFLLENSIPGAHLSSVERKLKAIPISSANSITWSFVMKTQKTCSCSYSADYNEARRKDRESIL